MAAQEATFCSSTFLDSNLSAATIKYVSSANLTSTLSLWTVWRSPTQHALFTEHARSKQYLPIAGNIQEAFDSFYNTALGQLDRFYPEKKISITSREPSFMTPEVKSMLRKKN